MSGVGPIELVILITVLVMLFGPTLLAFWLGFTLGKKRTPAPEKTAERPSPAPAAPVQPENAPQTESGPEEEPADE